MLLYLFHRKGFDSWYQILFVAGGRSYQKIGLFAIKMIKNGWYCHTLVLGDVIDDHVSTNYMGEKDILKENLDNHHHKSFCLQYTDYVIKTCLHTLDW